jgi:ferredoxin
MIITKKKDRERLLDCVKDYRSFFLIGCSECASLCGTGGDTELAELKEYLESRGKEVTGAFKAKTGCQVLGTKIELKDLKEEIKNADAIIVMSCGAGTQAAVEMYPDKPVYPSNDSLFLGNMTRFQMFDERCSLCGECILDRTGGICPLTTCPKGLLNGPCGGTKDGNCEVSPDVRCCWVRIYERMKKLDKLDELAETMMEPKDWSAGQKPKKLVTREEKKK